MLVQTWEEAQATWVKREEDKEEEGVEGRKEEAEAEATEGEEAA